MSTIEKKSLDFLIELGRVIRGMQMYNENHPIVRQGLQQAQKILEPILATCSSLSFGGDKVLLIQNKQITEKNAIADRFREDLSARNISGVMIRRGVPISELEAFVKLLSTKPESIVHDGAIKPEFLRPFKRISVNEIKYIQIGEDEDIESLTEARQFFNSLFSEEFKNLKGPDALKHIGEVIKKILPKLSEQDFEDQDAELWEFFERSVESFGGGDIRQTESSLMTTIRDMAPEIQKRMFGQVVRSRKQLIDVLKNFSDDRKASMIVQEAKSKEQLEKALETLLESKGDIVTLAESLSKKFGSGDSGDQEKLTTVFKMLQKLDTHDIMIKSKRGKVVIAETDEECLKGYQDFYQNSGFEVEVIQNGKELLQRMQSASVLPELLVMDVKLPELSGTEILGALDMAKIRIPVLLATDLVSERNSFEVQMYPKLQFVAKPFQMSQILEATNALCPPPEEQTLHTAGSSGGGHSRTEMDEERDAELQKARDIQHNLMPREIPPMEGYEVFAYYKAYDMIGGDYYDIIPIGEDHVGMLIADVSGHGITGAMVMVMIRSAIRTWAHTTTSPKELLAKVNPMVARDILPGFFCTINYAVLDMPGRKLTCVCAGHNPAVLWEANTKQYRFTKKGGMPLGIVSGKGFENSLQEEEILLEPGDRVVFYTDGMVETMSPSQEEYGEEKFGESLNLSATQRSDVCVKYMIEELFEHQGTAPQHDDLTVFTMRVL